MLTTTSALEASEQPCHPSVGVTLWLALPGPGGRLCRPLVFRPDSQVPILLVAELGEPTRLGPFYPGGVIAGLTITTHLLNSYRSSVVRQPRTVTGCRPMDGAADDNNKKFHTTTCATQL